MASFRKILFPTDFSPDADAALAHAMRLAGLDDGEVVVQHVVKSYFERNRHWTTLFDVRELEEVTKRRVETELSRSLAGHDRRSATIREVIGEGRPAKEILALAESERVDVVVMGRGSGAVTTQVIGAAKCPVLSVPAGTGARPVGRISKVLVAVDLSRRSRKLVNCAFDLKGLTGCEIHLLHAIQLPEVIGFGIQQDYFLDALDKLEDWAQNQMKNLTPHRALADPTVHRHIQEGSPIERISSMNSANNFDMIVLGTHGFGPVQKYFIGSTTERVLKRVQAPVLTVRV